LRTIRTIYYKLEENEKYAEVDSTLKELTE
jgi:hypothetical protein